MILGSKKVMAERAVLIPKMPSMTYTGRRKGRQRCDVPN